MVIPVTPVNYYCDYQRLPDRFNGDGSETCKIVGRESYANKLSLVAGRSAPVEKCRL
jgi:hypothetical protein